MLNEGSRNKIQDIISGTPPSIGKKIIAQQPAINFAEALAQVQRLKKISKVNSTLKNGR